MMNLFLGGMESVSAKLNTAKWKMANRRQAHSQIVTMLDGLIQRNFTQQGRLFETGGWKPLAESTIAGRTRNKQGQAAILMDNGTLKSRWKHYWDNDEAKIQSGADYGIYHDSDEPRHKLPQRKIMPRREHYGDKVRAIYNAMIKEAIK